MLEHDDGRSVTWPRKNLDPYSRPAISSRSGAIFRVHPYPTKINYRTIVPFILAHTLPGDVVYDGFAGTCTTGIAAAACVEPDMSAVGHLRRSADQEIVWGARRAICLDLGVLPTFIGRTLLKTLDAGSFVAHVDNVLASIQSRWAWLYHAKDPEAGSGTIRYVYHTELIRCDLCDGVSRYIDLYVDFGAGSFRSEADCPSCGNRMAADSSIAVTEIAFDDVLGKEHVVVKREPAIVFGRTRNRTWSRQVSIEDKELIARISETKLPELQRPLLMLGKNGRWGEMYRSGYHQDITHLHHFYTRRNFLALSILYNSTKELPIAFRDHFRLLVSAYNTAHSTLMTRFVFKHGSVAPVVTSCQPGALYIGGCPVEKNVFHGIRGKVRELLEASRQIRKWAPNVKVLTRAGQNSGLPSESVDYIFTDPPFAGNIQYSELNFLSEAWLNTFTENRLETIVSKAQDKGMREYEILLTLAFKENFRILKPGRFMTVIFHSKRANVWNILRRAIERVGFIIVKSSILDKSQSSFKQTTAPGAVKKDIVIATHKPFRQVEPEKLALGRRPQEFIHFHLSSTGADDLRERSSDYLFSRYVGFCLATGHDVPIDARQFREVLANLAELHDGYWYLRAAPLG